MPNTDYPVFATRTENVRYSAEDAEQLARSYKTPSVVVGIGAYYTAITEDVLSEMLRQCKGVLP